MGLDQNIEVEIREPTGLGLGTFDLYVVRQKIYEGELGPACQFKDAEGNWTALAERTEFADIFWLLGESTEDRSVQKRRTFGGWQTKEDEDSKPAASAQPIDLDHDGARGGLKSLTKRFRTQDLPALRKKKDD
jgi:hypothetical protein